MNRKRLSNKSRFPAPSPPLDGHDRPTKEQVSSKLRKEAWKWFKLRKAVPFCLAAVIGMFSFGGGVPTAKASDTIVDSQQRRSYSVGSWTTGSGTVSDPYVTYYSYYQGAGTGVSGWTNFVQPNAQPDSQFRYSFDNAMGDGGIIAAINQASATGGGSTYLSGGRLAGSTAAAPTGSWTTNPGTYWQYRSEWTSNSSIGGTLMLPMLSRFWTSVVHPIPSPR